MKNKNLLINIVTSIISLATSIGISFFLTPYIVDKIGKEAYGFIGLINNLVSYISIITIALNSMAGRFITIKIHQNNEKEANEYFNSVLISNIIMAIIIAIIAVILLINLNNLLDIPRTLILDVKITFIIVAIEFILNLICSIFGAVTFITDRLYLYQINTAIGNFLKVAILFILFLIFNPKLYFVSISNIVFSVFLIILNVFYTKTLISTIKINKKYFKIDKVIELIKSGIWNVIIRLSALLNTGLDLLLANVLVGASFMGILGITKTIPNCFTTFSNTLGGVFAPRLTIAYAKNDMKELKLNLKTGIKIMTIFTALFFAFIVVYSKEFYLLWVKGQNSELLYVLTVLSTLHMPITFGMININNIFTVTNKLKKNSIALVIQGIMNIVIVVCAVKILPTNISRYFIAGTSSVLSLLFMIGFTIPYATKCLNLKITTFFPNIGLSIILNIVIILIFSFFKMLININGWISLILACIVSCINGILASLFIVLNKKERNMLVFKVFKKANKRVISISDNYLSKINVK